MPIHFIFSLVLTNFINIMKHNYLKVAFVATMAGVTVTSCGGSQKATSQSKNPFGNIAGEAPCWRPDTKEYFTANGIAKGSAQRMDVLQGAALSNAQGIIRQKMKHAYQGAISDYSKFAGGNQGSTAASKVERAGDQILDLIVNDTEADCQKWSEVDDFGQVTCYVGIRISREEVIDKTAKELSKDEELRIDFNEKNYREAMEKRFKEYKEEQKSN
jgi:hypothetical protein